ncbi:Clathrin interactor EPSIN 1 [Sesamum angolense]|uniref:Clathrin interactor EPSIN 1 n=1 Tax=Sesamum angolense TaxID=2727404 RepID=A0AAE2C4K1_9LAMI|nr:Clathrin interactor EPSIN 1 [Sesamum angolense]
MSILGSTSRDSGSTNAPIFHEFKKQASFFFKEKIKTARLALTDVTPVQLLAEEATNGTPGGPDSRTLKIISRAAFEVDDYWRIVDILHKRLVRFDRRNWRESYRALIVLEHMLTHGPERVAEEFQIDRDVIIEMESFQHVDEKGFDWGLIVEKKCERVLKLLEKGPDWKEERDRARKVSRGIQGFGSFCHRDSSAGHDILPESSLKAFGRCNSELNQRIKILSPDSSSTGVDSGENLAPNEESRNFTGESKPLLEQQKDEAGINMSMDDHHHHHHLHHPFGDAENHPFDDTDNLTVVSLLSSADERQAVEN